MEMEKALFLLSLLEGQKRVLRFQENSGRQEPNGTKRTYPRRRECRDKKILTGKEVRRRRGGNICRNWP